MFITLEGPEGSGKTTAIKVVYEKLKELGKEVVLTREPGGVNVSEKIREIILDPKNTEMTAKTEALLYAAARSQHLSQVIIPAIDAGKLVICDRFIDSSLAYQGVGRNLGFEGVYVINKFAIGDYMPDLTIFFDINPEEGINRIHKNADRKKDRLDLEGLKFHQDVYDGYKKLCKKYKKRIKVIDASKTPEEVANDVLEIIIKHAK